MPLPICLNIFTSSIPLRIACGALPIIPLHYESSEYAYKFHLELPRWKQTAEIAKIPPRRGLSCALSASAHRHLPGLSLWPDFPMEEPPTPPLNPRPVNVATAEALTKSRDGDAEIYSFESQQTVPIRKIFLYKSIRRGELAYLIIGSADTEAQKAD